MGYGAQYFRHTVIQVASALLAGVLFYLLRIVFYQFLGPEEYGLFYSVFSFSTVLYSVLSFGFDPGMVPFVTRLRVQGEPAAIKQTALSCLAPQLFIGALFLLLVFAFTEPIAVACFQAPEAEAVLLIRLVAIHTALLLPYKTIFGLLLGLQCVASRNAVELGRIVVCLGVAALLLRRGHGYEAAALGYLFGTVAGLFVGTAAVFVIRPDVVRAKFRWRPDVVAEVFRSGKYATIAFGGMTLFANMDTIMLTLVLPDYRLPVAAYQLAVPTMMIINTLLLAAVANFMPMVTTLWHSGKRDQLADGIGRMLEAGIVVILPATALVAVFSDVLMETLFRRDVMNAPLIFSVLAVGAVVVFAALLSIHILTGLNRTKAACASVGGALALNLVLNVVLIRWFGALGAALATVASHLAVAGLALASIRRSLDIRVPVKPVLAAIAASGLSALVAFSVRHTALFTRHRLVVATLTGVVLYALLLALLEWFANARLRELAAIVLAREGRNSSGEAA